MQVSFGLLDEKYLAGSLTFGDAPLEIVLQHADVENIIQTEAISARVQIRETVTREKDFQPARNVSKGRLSQPEGDAHREGFASRRLERVAKLRANVANGRTRVDVSVRRLKEAYKRSLFCLGYFPLFNNLLERRSAGGSEAALNVAQCLHQDD